MPSVPTPVEAFAILRSLGAPARLVRHHELVAEACEALTNGLRKAMPELPFDDALVLAGAALHDAGKILHPRELDGPGSNHEVCGEELLLRAGLSRDVARFCRTHASWASHDATLEDMLVALADKLWKGKRESALEVKVCERIATLRAEGQWQTFLQIDALFERVAARGDERLVRSVPP